MKTVFKDGILLNTECLSMMANIPDKSIDMILCDLPYGTTACKWDVIIPFDKLWEQYHRIIKDNGAIVLTASQPFSSLCVASNINNFKYEWIWDKKIPSGMCNAKIQPMRQHEVILVFMNGKSFYYPSMTQRDKSIKSGGMRESLSAGTSGLKKIKKEYTEKYPTTILTFDKVRKGSLHPTQKPVALFEYLIKTYTNEGDLILDNCAGSGTTAIAAINTNRNYILMEQEQKYFDIINKRIAEHIKQKTLF